MKEQEKKQFKSANKKLAKGLSSLFESVEEVFEINETSNSQKYDVKIVNISLLEPNPDQPRKEFSQENIESLASSIEEFGFINPIVVQESNPTSDKYMIIAGERRYRAALHLGVEAVPVIVREPVEGRVVNAIALIENIQREDLNPVEEAECISQLIADYDCSHKFIADKLGKSRPYITNAMRILDLPQTILEDVKNGILSSAHARLLIGLENAEQSAEHIKNNKLSVRAAEDYIRSIRHGHANLNTSTHIQDSEIDTRETSNRGFDFNAHLDSAIYGTAPNMVDQSSNTRSNTQESAADISRSATGTSDNESSTSFAKQDELQHGAVQARESQSANTKRRYKLLKNQLPEGSVEDIENVLALETGMNVKIVDNDNSAELVIKFDSVEQLDYLIQALSINKYK